jgi:hypothetical protein
MNDTALQNLFAAVRARLQDGELRRETADDTCLSFGRARALALDPGRWRDAERAHVTNCRRCQVLVAGMSRLMPHPSLWTLLRSHLGLLSDHDQRALSYHAGPDGCPRCAARLAAIGPVRAQAVSFPRFALRNPAAAAAATGPLDVSARSSDGRIEAELVEEEKEILLEVRTRDAGLNHQLVGYTLRGATEQALVQGFLVLRPDVESWFAACRRFEAETLYRGLLGRCEEMLIAAVSVDALSAKERGALLEATSQLDRESRSAWAGWLAAVHSHAPAELQGLLEEVRGRVGG